jgi:hypothetical protein
MERARRNPQGNPRRCAPRAALGRSRAGAFLCAPPGIFPVCMAISGACPPPPMCGWVASCRAGMVSHGPGGCSSVSEGECRCGGVPMHFAFLCKQQARIALRILVDRTNDKGCHVIRECIGLISSFNWNLCVIYTRYPPSPVRLRTHRGSLRPIACGSAYPVHLWGSTRSK